MKTKILLLVLLCVSLGMNAQINNTPVKDLKKPGITTANFPKMDATIKEIIDGANRGTYKISMAALTLTKYKDTYSKYVGSTSFSTVSALGKITPLRKVNVLTAEGSFFINSSRTAANVRIFTTKLGGQNMSILITGNKPVTQNIKNLKIMKKGKDRYIITGDTEKDGNITNYIFNIYEQIIQ